MPGVDQPSLEQGGRECDGEGRGRLDWVAGFVEFGCEPAPGEAADAQQFVQAGGGCALRHVEGDVRARDGVVDGVVVLIEWDCRASDYVAGLLVEP